MRIGGFLAVLVLAGCGAAEAEEDSANERLVVVAPVATGEAVDRIRLLGDVHGEVEIRVFAQLPERIRQLHVREGQAVAIGDPIATLEADLTTSDVAQAGAALDASMATRDRLRAEVDRIRPLVAQRAVATSQLESLEANLRAAEAQVAQLRAAQGAARERRSRTVVRAPADGTIALLQVEEGDMVAPQMPLAMVVQMDRLRVIVRAVESDYVRLREGMEVRVAATSLEGVARTGTITQVSPVIDRLTRTAEVVVTVDNDGHALRPGMVAEVTVDLDRRDNVVMAPARAVVMTPRTEVDGSAAVYVVQEGVARRREVRIGERYDGTIEIRSGLEPGEEVVVRGQHLLREGTPVRTRPYEPAAPGSA